MRLTGEQFQKILTIGIDLTAEKDRNKLFGRILNAGMDITSCDAGTLYIKDGETLRFKVMKTLSMGVSRGEDGEEIDLPPVAFRLENVCAYSAIKQEIINIADVYHNDMFDFSGPKNYDKITGYHTQSMLVIPLIDADDEVIGVMQLINSQNADGEIVAFEKDHELIIQSLGSQTAVTLSNMLYNEELKEQMWSFAEALATAIDERTPYNATHTRKVAEYSAMLVDEVNREFEEGIFDECFDQQRKEQLVMSALLHDIGKMIVPLNVMNKATRLDEGLSEVWKRFELFECYTKIRFLKGEITKEEYEQEAGYLQDSLHFIEAVNGKGFLPDEDLKEIEALAHATCLDPDGNAVPLLTEKEITCLCIRKGTLTAAEREVMESHVVMTGKILEKVHFNRYFRNCAKWAVQHHETLSGSGYPNHLKAEELALEPRILAVADIYDALTCTDRPYKKPMPTDRAVSILESMVNEGSLDGRVVAAMKRCVLN